MACQGSSRPTAIRTWAATTSTKWLIGYITSEFEEAHGIDLRKDQWPYSD